MKMGSFLYVNREINMDSLLPFYINRAGAGDVKTPFNIERGDCYPYCVIHYVKKGSGSVFFRGRRYPVREGQAFILNAFEAHQYRADENSPFGLVWIEFTVSTCSRLMDSVFEGRSPVVDAGDSAVIYKYLLKILRLLEKNPAGNAPLIAKIIFSISLALLDTGKRDKLKVMDSSVISAVKHAAQYIDGHLGEVLTVERLSKMEKYDPTYFAKAFKRLQGITPGKYIMERKLNRAREALGTTAAPVEVIAEKLGFCNTSHFIRAFKKAEGLTPADYRAHTMLYRTK